MKRRLLVTIDAEDRVCGDDCPMLWLDGCCLYGALDTRSVPGFRTSLLLRHRRCLAAEKRAQQMLPRLPANPEADRRYDAEMAERRASRKERP